MLRSNTNDNVCLLAFSVLMQCSTCVLLTMSYDKAFLHDMYNLPPVVVVLSVTVGALVSVVVLSEEISTSIFIIIYNNYDLTDFNCN